MKAIIMEINEKENTGNAAAQQTQNPGQEGSNNSAQQQQKGDVGQQKETADHKEQEEEANREANKDNPAIGAGTE